MLQATTALPAISLRERVCILALVLVMHVGLVFVWMMQPAQPKRVLNDLSVSIAMQPVSVAKPQAARQVAPKTAPPLARSDEAGLVQTAPAIAAHAAPVEKPATEVTAPQQISSPPGLPDTEPDYKAGYLSNPRPAYPMVARRMGWQGRVILNVEVLAAGECGAVSVFRSSGHEVLDNAAMNTVKGWRFTPARHAGHIVTQWFKLPIVFSLEDNDT